MSGGVELQGISFSGFSITNIGIDEVEDIGIDEVEEYFLFIFFQ